MGRSRKLTLTDWSSANNALIQYFEGNKTKLKDHARISRTTVTHFFNEKPLGEKSFRKICLALRLPWNEVSSVDANSEDTNSSPLDLTPASDELVEKVRKHCHQKILERHSRIRLLNGKEIGVNQLYVDVWLLEKPEYMDFSTSESLLNKFDIAEDRLALSKRIRRDQGFKIANNESKLVILGKPGSGKTTFLKHLAMDWYGSKFQPDKITVFIELRQVQEPTWKLVNGISQELGLEEEDTLILLNQGNLLVLMDGLDEVPTDELRQNVQAQVKAVSEKYSNQNRFILTCRTQITRAIPSGFTSVEVADFSLEQVKHFVQRWFMANGQAESEAIQQWKTIQIAMDNQPDLRELTATPVLANLICVVLQDNGEIPTDRTKLYKKGINWLLSRWNDEKEIKGWELGSEAYRRLNTGEKETLLIEIAARKFENPTNFVLFEQDELVEQVSQKLRLVNTKEGIAVLKAIEAQHGLLIERADELWSFSHLTFQEHFTVQWLTHLPSQQLAERIASQQWKTVVEQLVKSQQPADRLLRLIKQAADQSIAQEAAIQDFLGWLLKQSSSYKTKYKPSAIRAFYYSLTRDLDRDLGFDLDLDRSIHLFRTLGFTRTLAMGRALSIELDYNLAIALDLALSIDITSIRTSIRVRDRILAIDIAIDQALTIDQSLAIDQACSPDLICRLHQLKSELPVSDYLEGVQHWWSLHGTRWIEEIRQVMLEYRNIGHDWNFTQEQNKKLQRYYDANMFLVSLLEIPGAVSTACRTEIEEELLLPSLGLQLR